LRPAALRRFAWNMVTNPILLGFLLGLLARASGLSLGGIPKQVVDMIAASAVPCALFALGLALHRYGVAGDIGLSTIISALKLMLLPLVVWLLARYVFALDPVYAGVAVVLFTAAFWLWVLGIGLS
jgi:predicted permease